jgi:CheY-like chemotaxis protein
MHDDTDKPRVLIVDDNGENIHLLARALHRRGYLDVGTARTTDEAVQQLESLMPDALIVDLRLLLLDGYGLLHLVRRSARWGAIPVLVLVSRHSASVIRAATMEGASGFITKPFNSLEITYKIEQAVRGVSHRTAELADLREPDPVPSLQPDQPRARRERPTTTDSSCVAEPHVSSS